MSESDVIVKQVRRHGKRILINVTLEDHIADRLRERDEKEKAKKTKRADQIKRHHDKAYIRVSFWLSADETDAFKREARASGFTQRGLVEFVVCMYLEEGLDKFVDRVGVIENIRPGGYKHLDFDLRRDMVDVFREETDRAGCSMSAVIRAGVRAFIYGLGDEKNVG